MMLAMSHRNPFEPSGVKSRRGGRVKQPLSRDAIVGEALRQITSDGLEGMSLRKVASALETGPASLYAYVRDLGELHALVLDRALAKVDVRASARGSWQERLVAVLSSYARVLSASRGLAKLAFGTVAVGPNALRITEAILALLEEGGVDAAVAAWAVDLLTLYVTAGVAEHADGLDPGAPDGAVAHAVARASEPDYPHIHAARAHLLSGTPEQRFSWATEVLLRGLLQAPKPPTAPPRRAAPSTTRRAAPRRSR
jgi:AcrR family transcriptional regulator